MGFGTTSDAVCCSRTTGTDYPPPASRVNSDNANRGVAVLRDGDAWEGLIGGTTRDNVDKEVSCLPYC